MKARWLTVAVIAGVWFILINQLRVEWSINAQYSYGWLVPLLMLYLLWERWKDAPPPGPPVNRFLTGGTAAALALAIFPLRLVLESNPDWRMPVWVLAFVVVGLTFTALLYAGGWTWLGHFGFPAAFFLVAVPWPAEREYFIMQHLMRGNAWMSVHMLVWGGLPAVQMGNVIRIPNGLVGIDEACSGVRSLQTTIMISLFLGEMYRFGAVRRALLFGAALLFALLCNLARTCFLVWLSAARGLQEMAKWHDTAGLSVLVLCVAGLWQMARFFQSRAPAPERPADAPLRYGRRPPVAALAAFGIWFLLSEGAIELWYRSHEWGEAANTHWNVAWPANEPRFEDVPIPEESRVILKYNQGRSVRWMDADGLRWTVFFFRWDPGRASALLARSHKPDICLPSAGLHLDEYLGIKNVEAGSLTLPFRSYLFNYKGRPLYVYYCLWEDNQEQSRRPEPKTIKEAEADTFLEWQPKTRLLAVKDGRRGLGQQVLEITISGSDSEEDAFAALKRRIASLVKT